MKELIGPFPQPGWRKRISLNALDPMQATYSGELKATLGVGTIGAVRTSGRVNDYWISANACGQDDDAPLGITGELYINGTTCLSTKPTIYYVSGEASQTKTTKASGSGITQAVIDRTADTFTPGDVLTYQITLARTASPDVEMSNLCIVVELEPLK